MKRQPPKPDIGERVNAEIRQLQKIDAILTCIVVASEYADEEVDLGDAVRVAVKLVRETVRKLDALSA